VRIFAVVNQKGGCGKTTTAINLAGVFAGRGYRTLLVDMDPQGHCAAGLAIPEQRVDQHIGDAMLAPDDKPVDPQRLLWRVSRNLDLAPSTVRLAALEASRGELAGKDDAEKRLKKVLARFDAQYDIGLIDCSPAIGLLTFNSLCAADEVIIPVETGFFSLQGATKQVNAIKSIGKRLGVALAYHLLATMHDPANMLSRDLLEELRRRFGNRVIPVVITHDQALRESASFGQPVVEYSRDSQASKDYTALAEWLIANCLKPGAPRPVIEDPEPPLAPEPIRVHVVPGIAEKVVGAAPASNGFGDLSPVATISNVAVAVADPKPSFASPAAATTAVPVATISRAAEMAQRTRKLQRAVAIAEAKVPALAEPVRELFSSPAPPVTLPAPQPTAAPTAAPAPAPKPAESTRPIFGVQATPRGVHFVQPLSIGQSVAVAGEFNDWTPERTPLRANPYTGALEALVNIRPGFFQYRLVVDGRWMPDPFNPAAAPNPFGGTNSVVLVPSPSELQPSMTS